MNGTTVKRKKTLTCITAFVGFLCKIVTSEHGYEQDKVCQTVSRIQGRIKEFLEFNHIEVTMLPVKSREKCSKGWTMCVICVASQKGLRHICGAVGLRQCTS